MTPTMELRFVRRTNGNQPRMILQQKWTEQVVITIGGANQITEWRDEWRDVEVSNVTE